MTCVRAAAGSVPDRADSCPTAGVRGEPLSEAVSAAMPSSHHAGGADTLCQPRAAV
ncbi:MAG: hypothetical protein ACR2KO_06015 [Geodermatophilaceae bacterium]